MQQKAINIQGISSYFGPSSVTDGQCIDVMNARNVGGVIKPVNKEKIIANLMEGISGVDPNKIKEVYFHAKAQRYIVLFQEETGYSFIEYGSDFSFIGTTKFDNTTPVVGITFIGNIMAVFHEDKTVFYLFRDNQYESLGEKPPMPKLKIQVKRYSLIHDYDVGNESIVSNEGNQEYKAKGIIDACIRKGNESGFFIDRVIVRYAYRLYDGSYIMHSAPILIEDDSTEYGYRSSNIKIITVGAVGSRKWNVGVKMFSLIYTFDIDPVVERWKDLIVAIDVFCSNSIQTMIPSDGVEPTYMTDWGGPGELIPTGEIYIRDQNLIDSKVSSYVDNLSLREEITETRNFYLSASFDIYGGKIEKEIYKDKSKDVFSLNPEISDDNYSHVSYSSAYPYVYNSKLHLAGVIERLFDGYGEDAFSDWGVLSEGYEGDISIETVYDVSVYVSIKTAQGTMVVKKTFDSLKYPFARMLSYPDNRAFKMQIIFKRGESQAYSSMTIPLTPHKYLNISYFLNPTQTKIDTIQQGRFYGISPYSSISIETLNGKFPTVTNKLERQNVLKVSNVDNPFFFPNDSTYTVGDEKIIGLASVSTTLSTGQVGQFPLYVFATDGIYSMEVDTTGKLTYSNMSAIERYVCNNPKSITPAVGGVFFTTDQGVMYLSGSEVKNVSEAIKYNRLLPDSNLLKNIYSIERFEFPGEFEDFISEGVIRIAYLYKTNEIIIVNNRVQEYSYKYCINSGFWYRISNSYTNFLNAYPDCLAFRDGVLYDIDQDKQDGENSLLILSGPMNLESTNHKKIIQSVLRCDLYVKNRLGFYVMGSLDGEQFNLVGLKEIVDESSVKHCVDLVTKMKRSRSYKYFSFAITGTLDANSSINYVGVTFDDSMTNRLR